MNKPLIISYKVKDSYYIDKILVRYNISFLNKKYNKDLVILGILEKEFDKLLSYDYKHVLKLEKRTGLKNIYDIFLDNLNSVIISLIIMILMYLSNFLILRVNVHTSDIYIKKLITYKLIDFNIDSYSIKKDKKSLNKIKDYLLEKYKDDIEWIEITPHGYSYDVNVIKRKIKKPISTNDKCNYVARKSGNIKSIKVKKGVLLVQENNYVKAGDILIGGNIIYNEELKNETCASGYITGEVWYKVDLSYPLTIKKEVPEKKKQINFDLYIFNKRIKIFNDKYKNKKYLKKIGNNYLGISIYKTYKNKDKCIKLNSDESLKKALEKAKKNVLVKLPKSSKILSQNILKKYVKNDRIYIEVLITTEEEIGVVENYY